MDQELPMVYALYYWPSIQGRGEFVRLAMAGLNYAFPHAMANASRKYPRLLALHSKIQDRPRIAAYLASPRRIPFNNEGIFRHYPELDAARRGAKALAPRIRKAR